MRFLCAGGLHLGRRVTGIPAHLSLDPARLSTVSVWDQLIETAITERVDAVLLAGNLVDRENRLFEPLGPIERGLTTLARHEIPLFAVAGDQDFDVLRRIADNDTTGALRVIGRDSRWTRDTVQGTGDTSGDGVTLLGWSAAGQTAPGTPLVDVPAGLDGDQPVIALVHGTLAEADAATGVFAPVLVDDLGEHAVDLWILGHGSQRDVERIGDATVLQPGAACPLGPDEPGPHGVWIVDIAAGSAPECRPVAIAPVRFEPTGVDLTGLGGPEQIENEVIRVLHETLAAAIADDPGGHLVCVPCELHVTGTTPRHAEVPALLHDLARTLDIQHRGVIAAIGSVRVDTWPAIDLAPLVGRPDPVGELARLLTSLDDEGEGEPRAPAHEALLQRTATRLQGVHRARVFASVANDPEPGLEQARTALRREAWTVLDALVRQRGVE
jgi:DNA repair protein SbcD/Mre11